MAWILQRGNKFYVGWREKGKDLYVKPGFATEKEAESARLKKEWELSLETPTESVELPKEITIDELIGLYSKQADIKKQTLRVNRYSWAKFKTLTGSVTLEDAIREGIVKDLKTAAEKNGVSSMYLSLIIRDMRKLIKYARSKGLVRENPFEGVELPEQQNVARFITVEEEQALIAHSSPLMKKLIQVELKTGLRASQLAALDWAQIDLKSMILLVKGQKRQKPRHIPIFEDLTAILGEPKPFGSVFPEFEGFEPHEAVWKINGMWNIAKRKAKINGRLRFHDLRHTCASRLAQKLTPYELRDFFGWSSVALTDRYTHTRVEDIRKKMQG